MDRGRRGEILTFPDTLTTQGFSLWSLNIVVVDGQECSFLRVLHGWTDGRAGMGLT